MGMVADRCDGSLGGPGVKALVVPQGTLVSED